MTKHLNVRSAVAVADPSNIMSVVKPSSDNCIALTPHATDPLITTTCAIQVNVAGTVACRFEFAAADVTLALSAGVIYPYRLTHIRVSGTSATGIHGHI